MSEEEKSKLLLIALLKELGSPGIVVDADVAARTACRCYTVRDVPKICYSRGVIGSLSPAQKEAYCNPLITLGESKRAKAFIEAAEEAKKEIAGIPKGERLEPWLHSMSKALAKRGIEI